MSSLRSKSERSWGVRFRKAVQLLVGTMGVLLLCLPLFSQGNFGRILGSHACRLTHSITRNSGFCRQIAW